jgi:hypothetical protein
MYQMRTKNCSKRDLKKRWALPERVFFACGACHILAYAFITRYNLPDATAVWIKPRIGHRGNHVFVSFGEFIFDYHDISKRDVFLAHYWKRAKQAYPGWDATLVELPKEVLVSEQISLTYDGLWLRQPDQFHKNALIRADEYLNTKLCSQNAPSGSQTKSAG